MTGILFQDVFAVGKHLFLQHTKIEVIFLIRTRLSHHLNIDKADAAGKLQMVCHIIQVRIVEFPLNDRHQIRSQKSIFHISLTQTGLLFILIQVGDLSKKRRQIFFAYWL